MEPECHFKKANREFLKPYRLMLPDETIMPGDLYLCDEIYLAEPTGAYWKLVEETGRDLIKMGCKLEFYTLRPETKPIFQEILTNQEIAEIFHD